MGRVSLDTDEIRNIANSLAEKRYSFDSSKSKLSANSFNLSACSLSDYLDIINNAYSYFRSNLSNVSYRLTKYANAVDNYEIDYAKKSIIQSNEGDSIQFNGKDRTGSVNVRTAPNTGRNKTIISDETKQTWLNLCETEADKQFVENLANGDFDNAFNANPNELSDALFYICIPEYLLLLMSNGTNNGPDEEALRSFFNAALKLNNAYTNKIYDGIETKLYYNSISIFDETYNNSGLSEGTNENNKLINENGDLMSLWALAGTLNCIKNDELVMDGEIWSTYRTPNIDSLKNLSYKPQNGTFEIEIEYYYLNHDSVTGNIEKGSMNSLYAESIVYKSSNDLRDANFFDYLDKCDKKKLKARDKLIENWVMDFIKTCEKVPGGKIVSGGIGVGMDVVHLQENIDAKKGVYDNISSGSKNSGGSVSEIIKTFGDEDTRFNKIASQGTVLIGSLLSDYFKFLNETNDTEKDKKENTLKEKANTFGAGWGYTVGDKKVSVAGVGYYDQGSMQALGAYQRQGVRLLLPYNDNLNQMVGENRYFNDFDELCEEIQGVMEEHIENGDEDYIYALNIFKGEKNLLEEDIVDIKNASAKISDAVKEVIYSKGVDSTNYNFNFTDEFVRYANDMRDSNTKNDGDAGL